MKRRSVFWDAVLHGSTEKENAFKQPEWREVCLSNVKYLQSFTCVCDCDESPRSSLNDSLADMNVHIELLKADLNSVFQSYYL